MRSLLPFIVVGVLFSNNLTARAYPASREVLFLDATIEELMELSEEFLSYAESGTFATEQWSVMFLLASDIFRARNAMRNCQVSYTLFSEIAQISSEEISGEYSQPLTWLATYAIESHTFNYYLLVDAGRQLRENLVRVENPAIASALRDALKSIGDAIEQLSSTVPRDVLRTDIETSKETNNNRPPRISH